MNRNNVKHFIAIFNELYGFYLSRLRAAAHTDQIHHISAAAG
jgi:hypothetical protein